MKRFIFVTDTHLRIDNPATRIDNVWESQLAKLSEIVELVKEYDVDAILHGGDFFNVKNPPHKLVADVINWCKHLETPVFVVTGNHDITGYNLDSVKSSGLGVLFESGAVDPLNLEEYKKDKIIIKAIHSSLNFEQDYMLDEKYKDYFKIIISHNYVIPADSMPWGFIHPKDIKTNADLVLCGHYHVPYDYSTQTTRWINPGTLCRWKINEKDHKPKVLLIEVENKKYTVTELYLKSVKPANEVFNVELVEQEKQRAQDIQEFVSSLEKTSFQNVDIEQVIKQSGTQQGISEEILNEILLRVKSAKEILK